jgi:anaerobic selenocysteine-containing dehydrogenase
MLEDERTGPDADPVETHFRACHLCEAICGLQIKTQGSRILEIKGDALDPLSRGHICPKAIALKDMHEDPDRLSKPMKKSDGKWNEISWDQAFKEIAERLCEIQKLGGEDAVAVYAGNPNVHNYGNLTHGRLLRKAIGTKSNFSATSLDQLPHHFVSMFLYGHQFLVPVPDIDRTDYMLVIGANPLASNGSMMTVPDVKNRLKAIQRRGGKVVTIDPRRTETAALADQHIFVKPETDIYLLLAFVREIFVRDAVDTGFLTPLIDGFDEIKQIVEPFSIAVAARKTGISEHVIDTMITDFLEAESAVCYGRMGVSVQSYGTLCHWMIQLINILTGNLDREGGAMFPSSAVAYVKPGEGGAGHFDKFRSRVSKLPEFGGELPSAVMAEEILQSGPGQIKALITLAGNPVLSSPNGRLLDTAIETLDLMVSVDIYLNETTRHADYILPSTGPLEHDHYDLAFLRLAVRDYAKFSEAIFDKPKGTLHDWEILSGLSKAICERKGVPFKPLIAPHQIVDFGLQTGPYGKPSGDRSGLSLDYLKAHPSGVDLGPLKSGLAERLCTSDGRINLVIEPLISHLNDLIKGLQSDAVVDDTFRFRLIGRRHVRSNNSWMHNYKRLMKGKPRHRALMNPEDLAELGLGSGDRVVIETRVGSEEIEVEASDEMMPGVISIPHGWGHNRQGIALRVAEAQPGASINDLLDHKRFDPVTGNAALNGEPCAVKVCAV